MAPPGVLSQLALKERRHMPDDKNPFANLPTNKLPDNRRPSVSQEHLAGLQHPNHKGAAHPQVRAHHGPDGRRRYHHSHSLHLLPTDLQKRVSDAHHAMSDLHYKQMNTPVPTNPAQCPNFPHPHQIKDDIRRARQAAIDDWHEENPHHRVEDHHG
jgi:hypothetical protein